MARAFYDDPVMSWLLSKDNARTARLTRLFATIVRHQHLAGGGVEVARGAAGIGGAALWDPPDRWRESRRQQLAMTPGFLRVFGFRTAKARAALDVMMRVHPEEPHWYLAAIGSDPTVRGQGFGQVLMRSRLDRCDAEHCPAYLESTKPENVPYYQRFGFRVTREIALPDAGRCKSGAQIVRLSLPGSRGSAPAAVVCHPIVCATRPVHAESTGMRFWHRLVRQ